MGHKGKMLPYLWDVISKKLDGVNAFADPFCGSGAVSWFVSTRAPLKVVSGDLQLFASVRSAAVVERTANINNLEEELNIWFRRAESKLSEVINYLPLSLAIVNDICEDKDELISYVKRSRDFCADVLPQLLNGENDKYGISLAYGGHYFSIKQALILDSLRQTVPENELLKNVFIAALIDAASRCSASPGHTAQPFQPTTKSVKYIAESWGRDVWTNVKKSVIEISALHALVKGKSIKGDYKNCLDLLCPGDMVFADPPYSDVQYSRFYHVLESLARGECFEVTGVGRYPDQKFRPVSHFSMRSFAFAAASDLIMSCAERRLKLLITFPNHVSSNGLSSRIFKDIGVNYFKNIEEYSFSSTFSTLGGNGKNRKGRIDCEESIICMIP